MVFVENWVNYYIFGPTKIHSMQESMMKNNNEILVVPAEFECQQLISESNQNGKPLENQQIQQINSKYFENQENDDVKNTINFRTFVAQVNIYMSNDSN